MDTKIEKLKTKFPDLTFEKQDRVYVVNEDGDEERSSHCIVSGLRGNNDLEISLRSIEEFDRFESFMESSPELLKDAVGCIFGNSIDILLAPVNRRMGIYPWRRIEGREIKTVLHYYNNEISVVIGVKEEDSDFTFLTEHSRQMRRRFRRPITATINGLKRPTSSGIESDIRNILSSVLFDLEYTYNFALETVNLDSLQVSRRRLYRRYSQPPEEEIPLVYKAYIPELLEYYHAGEKVDYLPFRYICYFHVLEYFSDKSAYHIAAGNIRNMLLKPDFHSKVDTYVGKAIQIIKKESERNLTDKAKLSRVLKQFTTLDEVKSFLDESGLLEYFTQSVTLKCSKDLVLPAIDFSSDSQFFDTLNKRIYSLRCSIVHSNPDFDDSKAIPFTPTGDNLEVLRTEIILVSELSRVVITKSSTN